MKQQVKYHVVNIPEKLKLEVKLLMDDQRGKPEYTSVLNGDSFTSLTMYPLVALSIIRTPTTDENGLKVRAPFNPNDGLIMGRYNYPILLRELNDIMSSMRVPELYTYTGKRLELNDALAEKTRKAFMVGNTAVELTPIVITNVDDTQVEGIKIKFKNEQSTVLLTLNDMTALLSIMNGLDIDSIAMMLFTTYLKTGAKTVSAISPQKYTDISISDDTLPY